MEPIDPKVRQQFQDALRRGDMFALFERTREAIELYPDDPDARYLQALAMARLGDPMPRFGSTIAIASRRSRPRMPSP